MYATQDSAQVISSPLLGGSLSGARVNCELHKVLQWACSSLGVLVQFFSPLSGYRLDKGGQQGSPWLYAEWRSTLARSLALFSVGSRLPA